MLALLGAAVPAVRSSNGAPSEHGHTLAVDGTVFDAQRWIFGSSQAHSKGEEAAEAAAEEDELLLGCI